MRDNPITPSCGRLKVLSGVVDSLRLLKSKGYFLVVVTNRAGDEIAENEKADYRVTGLPDAVKIILS